MHVRTMPEDYALVLQQVDESGEEDLTTLAESLRLDKTRLSHIVESLRNKGLVSIEYSAHDIYVRLSTKGKKLIEMLWPEARLRNAY